eukprot:SAG22_NODE_113_length_19407_cov_214.925161_10_plen_81_part_00
MSVNLHLSLRTFYDCLGTHCRVSLTVRILTPLNLTGLTDCFPCLLILIACQGVVVATTIIPPPTAVPSTIAEGCGMGHLE